MFRIEKGQAGPEELAAITAVLLARVTAARTAGAGDAGTPARPGQARWAHPEPGPDFRAAHSWRR
ncbi:hypothetical protein FraQA3DRAFT_4646 [Frankia sp. QA3]|nr:hypothetical protein FraQA3DRAFT_4646 [Frankia sp. QA3]